MVTMKNTHLLSIVQLLSTTAFFSTLPTSRAFGTTSIRISFEASSSPNWHPHRNLRRWQPARMIGSESAANEEKTTPMPNNDTPKILGICGGIGSGKSTACRLMVDSLGCVARVDADKLAHVVYEPGSKALEEIAEEFGKDVLDDSDTARIDRKKLGEIVFNDAESMSKLEHIVWPHVREKIEQRIEEITQEHQSRTSTPNNIIVIEAALLLETNWHDLLDGLWVIQSSRSVATRRLTDNRGLTEEEALVRIRAQEERRGIGGPDSVVREVEQGLVTAVITNDGTLKELRSALEEALCDPVSFKR